MRYTHEFKIKCIELYRKGRYPETPEGLSDRKFHQTVREWVRIEENCGIEALKHKNQNKETTLKTFLDFLGGENLFHIKSATRVSRK